MPRALTMALGVVMVLSLAGIARAEPTVTDIATCNQHAARTGAPSALPGPERSPQTVRPLPDDARGGAPVALDTGREKTDPSGTIVTESTDPLVKGMDAGKLRDPVYRAAYRECMARRLGHSR